MIDFIPRGIIYDLDDTLLDNRLTNGFTLHGLSRLEAVHKIGVKYSIKELINFSAEDNKRAALESTEHTIEGSVWRVLIMCGLVKDSNLIDKNHPLLIEISDLKNDLHINILVESAKEIPGASNFIKSMHQADLDGGQAIASMAQKTEIETFLNNKGLGDIFADSRIISKNDVKNPKPHPEAFDKAFKALKLPEQDRRLVCAFEDDPKGIKSAKDAGLYVCAITTRFNRQHLEAQTVKPDLVADSYAEFADHFNVVL